jgi:hypothetical protein
MAGTAVTVTVKIAVFVASDTDAAVMTAEPLAPLAL